MPYATLDDVKTHLPLDKINVSYGEPEYELSQIDAERVIRGRLSGIFSPTTLALWTGQNGEAAPAYIRAIAGRLVAAFKYFKRYAENTGDLPDHAQRLYTEAMAMLDGVVNGTVILEEVEEIGRPSLDPLYFWPNDTTDPPKFRMNSEF